MIDLHCSFIYVGRLHGIRLMGSNSCRYFDTDIIFLFFLLGQLHRTHMLVSSGLPVYLPIYLPECFARQYFPTRPAISSSFYLQYPLNNISRAIISKLFYILHPIYMILRIIAFISCTNRYISKTC